MVDIHLRSLAGNPYLRGSIPASIGSVFPRLEAMYVSLSLSLSLSLSQSNGLFLVLKWY